MECCLMEQAQAAELGEANNISKKLGEAHNLSKKRLRDAQAHNLELQTQIMNSEAFVATYYFVSTGHFLPFSHKIVLKNSCSGMLLTTSLVPCSC